jgi:hypothetical protein
MSGVDNLTVLQADGAILAKTWCKDGTIRPYGGATLFLQKQQKVRGIGELSKLLTKLESKSQMCIIRGQYSGNDPAGKVLRRKTVFRDQSLHTILIEVDGFEPITADPVTEPQAAIDEYVTTLPKAFHGASYHWQLSSSAGHPTKLGLRAHVWFWLAEPRTSAELKAWGKAANVPCDHSVFAEVQPHYTAAPVFEPGVIDPVATRSGFAQGARDTVELTIDPAIFEKAAPIPSASSGKPHHFTLDDVREILNHVEGNVDRESWLHTLWALRRTWRASEGRLEEHDVLELADEWSARGEPKGYEGLTDVEAKWLQADDRDDGPNVGTLVNQARAGGWQPTSEQNERLVGSSAASPEEFDLIADPVDVPPDLDRFRFVLPSELMRRPPPIWFIKNVLPQADLALIYGLPGSGKSFLLWDMVACISRGVPWRGLRVRQAKAGWIAAEASGSVGPRSSAYVRHHGLPENALDGIPTLAATPSLRIKADVDQIIVRIKELGIKLVVIDTLTAVNPGADENSVKDMTPIIDHCRRIRAETGAMCILVHHSGKDTSRGSRGTNSLPAAVDVELFVERNGDDRTMHITKSRDAADGAAFGFKLLVVSTGQLDEDGDELKSCVIEHLEHVPKKPKTVKLGPNEKAVQDALNDLSSSDGAGVDIGNLITAAVTRLAHDPESGRDRRREHARRAIDTCQEKGVLLLTDNVVYRLN